MGAASAGIGAASHNIEAAAGNSINSFQLLIPPTTMLDETSWFDYD